MIGRYFFQCSVSTIRCLHYMMILDRLFNTFNYEIHEGKSGQPGAAIHSGKY